MIDARALGVAILRQAIHDACCGIGARRDGAAAWLRREQDPDLRFWCDCAGVNVHTVQAAARRALGEAEYGQAA